MSKFVHSWTRVSLLGCVSVLALGFSSSMAAAATVDNDPTETVVVTGTRFNTDSAPAKASVNTTEPQTIINRAYIENFLPPQQDYNGILAIVPSMTGNDPAGPGLSDGGAKNTLRGFPDGSFAFQYDTIPFGDTNGPSHHSISYFPASNIGSAVVDRGPGNAGNLGAATYGGTVKLFSPTLTDDFNGEVVGSIGSFNTLMTTVTAQSGTIDFLGKTRILASVQGLMSDSALSLQNVMTKNGMFKMESDLTPDWRVTLYGSYSFLNEHLSDNNGLTPAQVAVYGKNFALQNGDPNLPTYAAYNITHKQTDFDYIKVNGEITDRLKVENTAYTYSYWNHTISPNSQLQTLPQIQADSSADNGPLTLLNGTKLTNQLLGYTKENAYRVYGDVPRASYDYQLGPVTGQVRAGVWLEDNETKRFRYYFDSNLCAQNGIFAYDYGRQASAAVCGVTQPAKSAVSTGALGYSSYDEYTSWQQYEPFLEVEIKPFEDLTLTPGVKYVHWDHKTNSPVETKSLCGIAKACPGFNALGQNFQESFTTTDTLPFFQANYKIDQSWSVYAEYAKGIYVPDISVFETSAPLASNAPPAAQTSTNYQVGTVFYADQFTFDADLYYIPINNNYIAVTGNGVGCPSNETCYTNIGQATYKGIEAEGTYSFDKLGGMDLKGLSIFANGALMSSKQQNGLWIKSAPQWTAAGGLLFMRDGWRFSLIDKLVGPEYSDNNQNATYKLPNYQNVTATVGYSWSRFDLSLSIDNLLDERPAVNISEGGTGTSLATSTDQYQFQSPLSVSFTAKVLF